MSTIGDLPGHPTRASSSKGYKSGRSSWRGTPEARSTSSTRSGGTATHWATACFVIRNDAASLVRPPAPLMARFKEVFDMADMSSTSSHRSQDPLHLQRQATLYVVDMTLGNLIKKARITREMSLEQLGDALGVSRQLVWQWERGKSDARKHIKGLSVALDVPVEYFYGPSRTDVTLEAKFKRLHPDQQELVTSMVDTMLGQIEKDTETPNKA